MEAQTIAVALGSNLNHPEAQVRRAIQTLQNHPSLHLTGCSKLYRTRPLGPQDQPQFVNAVVILTSSLSPLLMLDLLQWLERQHGRKKGRHWGERTLDADLLFYGDRRLTRPRLQIPHPEMLHRDFVIRPLMDVLGADYVCDGKKLIERLTLCDPFIIGAIPNE